MLSSKILELINEVEDKYPVQDIIVDGIHIWPILRIELNFLNCDVHYNSNVNSQLNKVSLHFKKALQIFKDTLYLKYAYFADYSKSIKPNRHFDILFLSDGISFYNLGGYWYEKYCDPLIERFKAVGRDSLLLTPLYEHFIPRHSPSIFIQPRIDFIKISKKVFAISKKNIHAFNEIEKIISVFKTLSPNLILPSTQHFIKQVKVIKTISKYYKKILESTNVSVAFSVGYYSNQSMALNLACRNMGVPSIDIQHGVQGDFHVAYGLWNKVPDSGYELLPSIFWCWTDKETKSVNKWNTGVNKWHRTVVGGNPWLEHWKLDHTDITKRYNQKIINVKKQYPRRINVLVTLQFGAAYEECLKNLIPVITKSGQKYLWWIRVHPCMLDAKEETRKRIFKNDISNAVIDEATDIPLFILLKHVDIHLTHSSSVVLEAEELGVPSIVINDYGSEFFPEQISTGSAILAYTTDEIIASIKSLSAANRLKSKIDPSSSKIERGINYVLKCIPKDVRKQLS